MMSDEDEYLVASSESDVEMDPLNPQLELKSFPLRLRQEAKLMK